jgi:adenylosuccinate lyase
MMKNLELTNGLIFSQALLLELAGKGVSREEAYKLVQRNAMECWKNKTSFKKLVSADEDIRNHLSSEEIEQVFSFDRYLKHIDYIFSRIGI